jgi:hypothetical protein
MQAPTTAVIYGTNETVIATCFRLHPATNQQFTVSQQVYLRTEEQIARVLAMA